MLCNRQPKWDIFEAVVLLDGYLEAQQANQSKTQIVRHISADLRQMAANRGIEIDDIYRNENGISYQIQSMDSAYKGKKVYVPATRLFEETVRMFRCEGNHPWRHVKESCSCYPKTVQRGASSVYFPVVHSSLVIPPYADKLNAKIEQSKAFEDCMTIINDEEPEDRIDTIKKKLSKWVEKIALEIGAPADEIEKILSNKWLDLNSGKVDVTSIQYRVEEYIALSGEIGTPAESGLGDFSREEMDISEYNIPHIKSVSLVDKVRVVNALIGFSRIQPAMTEDDNGFVNVKEPNTRWYPAYEVRGEGIFIEFFENDIENWIAENPAVSERIAHLNANYAASFIGKNHPRSFNIRFIFIWSRVPFL